MEALYHQTNKLLHEVHGSMARFEKAGNDDEKQMLENDLHGRIDQIVTNCERLEILVNKEPPTRRANAKLRVDQLKYDCQHLQSSMRQMQHRR